MAGHRRASAKEIDIRPSCRQMLDDLGHPFADGEPLYDITFENVQAGERTSHLFRLANHHGAIVVGTGDLSELALGWCTYGVGDHMSHYNVNASVPKTLIKHLVRWVADAAILSDDGSDVLRDILATEISPSWCRRTAHRPSSRASAPRDTIGPYELQDFHLYYIVRYGFRPSKVALPGAQRLGRPPRGSWPGRAAGRAQRIHPARHRRPPAAPSSGASSRPASSSARACPTRPKVGSGGSLSPRGDWRAPSDSRRRCGWPIRAGAGTAWTASPPRRRTDCNLRYVRPFPAGVRREW